MKRLLAAVFALFFCLAVQAKNHVVFLHGYDFTGSSDGGAMWDTMRSLLVANAGYAADELHAISYYSSDFGYSTSTPIETVADGVAKEITEIYYDAGEEPVDIVAHSMGGLIVRAMLANELIDRQCIGKFITLGTPHYGQNLEEGNTLGLSGKQATQMKYGSIFLWNLAVAWHSGGKAIDDTLCIAGSYDTKNSSRWDGLVHTWSAALGSAPCRYVKKCHSPLLSDSTKTATGIGAVIGGLLTGGIIGAIIGGVIGNASSDPTDALYQCADGKDDDVYVLVSEFLGSGNVVAQDSLDCSSISGLILSKGGIFLQVVDADGNPAVYKSSQAALIKKFWLVDEEKSVTPEFLEHGANDTESQEVGVEFVFGTIPAGTYNLTGYASTTTPAFTVNGVGVTGGRISVVSLTAKAEDSEDSGGGSDVEDDAADDSTYGRSYAGDDGGEPPFSAATVWDGWLEKDGDVCGAITVKVGKKSKADLKKATVTIIIKGEKKRTAKITIAADKRVGILENFNGSALALCFGERSLSGDFGGYAISGARNRFVSKTVLERVSALAELVPLMGTVNVAIAQQDAAASDEANVGISNLLTLSVSIRTKGKAKISGTLANGTKFTATAQLISDGDSLKVVPVIVTKKTSLAFLLNLGDDDAGDDGDSDLGDSQITGSPGTLADGAKFRIDAAALAALLGENAITERFPNGVAVTQSGTKFTVEKDAAAPSALKLSLTAKTGAFKGSFKAYRLVNGKAKAVTFKIAGVMIDGIGYGTAFSKSFGALPVLIE